MGEILKFPKDKVQYINLITELYRSKEYFEIVKYYDKLVQNFSLLYESFVFDYLATALFELGFYQKLNDLYFELQKFEYETFRILYLTLASMIASSDLYQANYLVKKSKLLKDQNFINFLSPDEATFVNLKSLDQEAFSDVILTIILVNYVQAIAKESLHQEISTEYLLYRFYDLINIVLEVGFSNSIISYLTELGQKNFVEK